MLPSPQFFIDLVPNFLLLLLRELLMLKANTKKEKPKMGKLSKDSYGFTAVEVFLVILTLAIIGGAGYLVAKHINKKTATPVATTTAPTAPNKPTTPAQPATASWYLYTSPGNNYTMRIPDGWTLVQNGTDNHSPLLLYPDQGNTLAIKQGTKGTVTAQSAVGRDATPTLGVQWCSLSETTCLIGNGSDVVQQASLKTNSGLTIEKYYSYESQPPTNISQPPQGTIYTYIIKNSSYELRTIYYFAPGQTDYHANVEQALATVQLN